MHDEGVLLVDEDLRVSRPATLLDHLVEIGIVPEVIYCDRFALGTLKDAVAGRWPVVEPGGEVERSNRRYRRAPPPRRGRAVVDCAGVPGARLCRALSGSCAQ